MWVGKFDFRKQLPLALRAIAIANNPNIVLDIYGGGRGCDFFDDSGAGHRYSPGIFIRIGQMVSVLQKLVQAADVHPVSEIGAGHYPASCSAQPSASA